MSKKSLKIQVLDEKVVERTAEILGPSSAAQLALDDAKVRRERGENVIFGKHGSMLVVVPAEAIVRHSNDGE